VLISMSQHYFGGAVGGAGGGLKGCGHINCNSSC
jgi:hypothetical protein